MFATETSRMRALVAGSLVLSIGGVAVAVGVTGDPLDGGRGGAVAVALTLVAFFLRRDIGRRLRKAFTETLPGLSEDIERLSPASRRIDAGPASPGPEALDSLTRRLDAIESSLRVVERSEQTMDRYVAAAAAVGTLFWGFGDIAAGWVLAAISCR
jgi:hypothetical protein